MGDYGDKIPKGRREYQKRRDEVRARESRQARTSLDDELKDIIGSGTYTVDKDNNVTITYPSGGRLVFKRDYYQTPDERIPNRVTYAIMAEKYGESYELLDQMKDTVTYVDKNGKQRTSNPDARRLSDGAYSDAKHPKHGTPPMHGIKNGVRSAKGQGVVKDVIIRIEGNASDKDVADGFWQGFSFRNHSAIERVVIIDGSGRKDYDRSAINRLIKTR